MIQLSDEVTGDADVQCPTCHGKMNVILDPNSVPTGTYRVRCNICNIPFNIDVIIIFNAYKQ